MLWAVRPSPTFILTCGADGSHESMGQFGDSIRLSATNGFSWNEFSTYAQRNCSRGDELVCSTLVYSPGSDQGNSWKHRLEIADVACAADVPARNYLHKIGVQLPGSDDSGGRERPGNDDCVLQNGEVHHLGIESVAREELHT